MWSDLKLLVWLCHRSALWKIGTTLGGRSRMGRSLEVVGSFFLIMFISVEPYGLAQQIASQCQPLFSAGTWNTSASNSVWRRRNKWVDYVEESKRILQNLPDLQNLSENPASLVMGKIKGDLTDHHISIFIFDKARHFRPFQNSNWDMKWIEMWILRDDSTTAQAGGERHISPWPVGIPIQWMVQG